VDVFQPCWRSLADLNVHVETSCTLLVGWAMVRVPPPGGPADTHTHTHTHKHADMRWTCRHTYTHTNMLTRQPRKRFPLQAYLIRMYLRYSFIRGIGHHITRVILKIYSAILPYRKNRVLPYTR